jgi:hypothetical protein
MERDQTQMTVVHSSDQPKSQSPASMIICLGQHGKEAVLSIGTVDTSVKWIYQAAVGPDAVVIDSAETDRYVRGIVASSHP